MSIRDADLRYVLYNVLNEGFLDFSDTDMHWSHIEGIRLFLNQSDLEFFAHIVDIRLGRGGLLPTGFKDRIKRVSGETAIAGYNYIIQTCGVDNVMVIPFNADTLSLDWRYGYKL